MNARNTRRAAATALASAAVAVSALTASTTANASPVSQASRTVANVAVTQPQTTQSRWYYYHSYFWGADCTRIGNYGLNHNCWNAYQCRGDWFNDYQLWYRH